MTLETIELSTSNTPDASVIWLHGLGADGHDFEGLVPELKLPSNLAIRFIFPHAPQRPITMNGGYVMRGWYDLKGLEFDHNEDSSGIHESSSAIAHLIDHEQARGIPSHRIVLAGFSQGGAIALHTALRYPKTLAGIMALSTYLPLNSSLENERNTANKNIPVFMAHGLQDEIVKYQFGVQSRSLLKQMQYPVEWHDYNMGHSVCIEEIEEIKNWLCKQFSN